MSPSSSQGGGTLNIRVNAQIDGKDIDLQFHSAEISQGLHELCTIRLELGFDEVKTDEVFKQAQDWMGSALSLTISDIANKDVEKKYTGVITSYSFTYVSLILEAKSMDVALTEGRRYRTFENMKLADIVNNVLHERISQFSVNSNGSAVLFPIFAQFGETDYDFLKRIAVLDGALFYHDGEKFIYDNKLGGGKEVALKSEEIDNIILDCHVGLTKWKASFYDVEKHNEPGRGTQPSQKSSLRDATDLLKKMHKASSKVFGSNLDELHHVSPEESDGASYLARSMDLAGASNLVKVTGETFNPLVAVGRTISCSEDAILKTPVVVASLKGAFKDNVYKASFEAVSDGSLILPREAHETEIPTYLQVGTVVDNQDDKKLGRVKIKFNWSDEFQTYWAPVMQPGAGGPSHGMHFTPRVGDSVLVGFENGDPRYPVVLGAMYNSESKPDFVTENGTEEILVAKTPNSTIRINQTQDKEEILLSMGKTKNIIRMELKEPQITVESLDGTITIHAKTIKIKADEDFEVEAKEIKMSAEKNIKLRTGENFEASVGKDQKMQVTGKAEITASQDATIKASMKVDIQAGSEVKLAGGGKVGIQGALVESTASGTNTIKGAMVMIN